MKILSIIPAQPNWVARYFYPPQDGIQGWHENYQVVVWGVIQDVKGQRVVGFCSGFYGPLRMSEFGDEECNFQGYVYEDQQPTKGKKS